MKIDNREMSAESTELWNSSIRTLDSLVKEMRDEENLKAISEMSIDINGLSKRVEASLDFLTISKENKAKV